MTPGQQLQRLLADVLRYDSDEIVALLPLAAALLSALCTRMLALQQQSLFPQTDYLLNVDEIAARLGKSTRWIRDNFDTLPFALRAGQEYRFSARALEEWIKEQLATKMDPTLPPERRQHER